MNSYSLVYENKDQMRSTITKNHQKGEAETLVQVFCGIIDEEYIKQVTGEIKDLLPDAKIIGSTTCGEIVKGIAKRRTCVITVTQFERTHIELVVADGEDQQEIIANSYRKMENMDRETIKMAICFMSMKEFESSLGLEQFATREKYSIAGGIAGNPSGEFGSTTYVFTENSILENGAVAALLINEDLMVYNGVSYGWVPIGRTFKITAVEGHQIKKLIMSQLGYFMKNTWGTIVV